VIAAVLLFRTRAPQAPVQEGQVQVEEEADLSQIEAELEALNIEELNLEVE